MIDSTGRLARGIAASSAFLLVTASAGFGAVFAWTSGSHHGPVLAGLAVCMAFGLEAAKPLALAQALQAFGGWRIVEGLALAALAAVAVAYSLSAELSLTAQLRGDAVAERTAKAENAMAAAARYARAETQLLALPVARPVAELDAAIAAALLPPGAGDCTTIDGPVSRRVCPGVAELRRERAVAEERGRLAAELREAEKDRGEAGAAVKPDAGAAALASYLGALGLKVGAALLSELLILIAVIGLEVGSALAGVLVRAAWRQSDVVSGGVWDAMPRSRSKPENGGPGGPSKGVRQVSGEGVQDRKVVGVQRWLAAHGGVADTSVRKLAADLGKPRATTYDELRRLADAGVITMQVGRAGVRLVAA